MLLRSTFSKLQCLSKLQYRSDKKFLMHQTFKSSLGEKLFATTKNPKNVLNATASGQIPPQVEPLSHVIRVPATPKPPAEAPTPPPTNKQPKRLKTQDAMREFFMHPLTWDRNNGYFNILLTLAILTYCFCTTCGTDPFGSNVSYEKGPNNAPSLKKK